MVAGDDAHHAQVVKGLLDLCLLATITDEPNYGYGMVQKLNDRGWMLANESSIYPVLKRLMASGCITAELTPSPSGPARKVYSVTEEGVAVLATWAADWRNVRNGVDSVLSDAGIAHNPSADPIPYPAPSTRRKVRPQR